MPYYIYILYSRKVDRYYVGETENIDNRLNAHLTGISTYTSMADDWKVVYSESFGSRNAAIRREKEIKRKKSRKYIEYLMNRSS